MSFNGSLYSNDQLFVGLTLLIGQVAIQLLTVLLDRELLVVVQVGLDLLVFNGLSLRTIELLQIRVC